MRNPAAKQYIKATRRYLTCRRKWKRRLTLELERTTELFLTDCPDASFEEICAALGEPEALAAELLREIPPEQQARPLSRRLRILIFAGCLAAAVCVCGTLAHQLWTVRVTTVVDYTDMETLPAYWAYLEAYGMIYEYNPDGSIAKAIDRAGNEVAVDADGIPLDTEQYPAPEEAGQ